MPKVRGAHSDMHAHNLAHFLQLSLRVHAQKLTHAHAHAHTHRICTQWHAQLEEVLMD